MSWPDNINYNQHRPPSSNYNQNQNQLNQRMNPSLPMGNMGIMAGGMAAVNMGMANQHMSKFPAQQHQPQQQQQQQGTGFSPAMFQQQHQQMHHGGMHQPMSHHSHQQSTRDPHSLHQPQNQQTQLPSQQNQNQNQHPHAHREQQQQHQSIAPSQIMSLYSSQQSQAHTGMTLTPAQLLQQQQGGRDRDGGSMTGMGGMGMGMGGINPAALSSASASSSLSSNSISPSNPPNQSMSIPSNSISISSNAQSNPASAPQLSLPLTSKPQSQSQQPQSQPQQQGQQQGQSQDRERISQMSPQERMAMAQRMAFVRAQGGQSSQSQAGQHQQHVSQAQAHQPSQPPQGGSERPSSAASSSSRSQTHLGHGLPPQHQQQGMSMGMSQGMPQSIPQGIPSMQQGMQQAQQGRPGSAMSARSTVGGSGPRPGSAHGRPPSRSVGGAGAGASMGGNMGGNIGNMGGGMGGSMANLGGMGHISGMSGGNMSSSNIGNLGGGISSIPSLPSQMTNQTQIPNQMREYILQMQRQQQQQQGQQGLDAQAGGVGLGIGLGMGGGIGPGGHSMQQSQMSQQIPQQQGHSMPQSQPMQQSQMMSSSQHQPHQSRQSQMPSQSQTHTSSHQPQSHQSQTGQSQAHAQAHQRKMTESPRMGSVGPSGLGSIGMGMSGINAGMGGSMGGMGSMGNIGGMQGSGMGGMSAALSGGMGMGGSIMGGAGGGMMPPPVIPGRPGISNLPTGIPIHPNSGISIPGLPSTNINLNTNTHTNLNANPTATTNLGLGTPTSLGGVNLNQNLPTMNNVAGMGLGGPGSGSGNVGNLNMGLGLGVGGMQERGLGAAGNMGPGGMQERGGSVGGGGGGGGGGMTIHGVSNLTSAVPPISNAMPNPNANSGIEIGMGGNTNASAGMNAGLGSFVNVASLTGRAGGGAGASTNVVNGVGGGERERSFGKEGDVPAQGQQQQQQGGQQQQQHKQQLPPHLASLNPGVSNVRLVPYTPKPKKEPGEGDNEDTSDGEAKDKDKDAGSPSPSTPTEPTPPESTLQTDTYNSTDAIPVLTPSDMVAMKEAMARDSEYEAHYRAMKARMAGEVTGYRTAWWQRDFVGVGVVGAAGVAARRRGEGGFDVRYPRPKNAVRERGRKARREGLRIPSKISPEEANRPELLVPIRLEFDAEHHKMRDTFVWNLNDPVVTPEAFAQSVVDDYGLALSYHTVITKSIQDQLSDYRAHTATLDGDITDGEMGGDETEIIVQKVSEVNAAVENVLRTGTLDDEEAKWWESWRKRRRGISMGRDGKNKKRRTIVEVKPADVEKDEEKAGDDKPVDDDEIEVDDKSVCEEMRILIKLDIIVGTMKLDDQFEWDLDNVDASPEQFAEVYAKELGLGGEFKTAIAHCLREQIQIYQKSLFLVGHPSDGSAVQDDDLRMSFLPSLTSGARAIDQVQSFTPLLNYLSDGEIERSEKEREKEMTKRRKRNTRGRRGIALPDREPIRTYRTPAIGFPELDPATLALAAAANAPTSRRAAAAVASVNIANMVASENGTSIMPLPVPMAVQQPAMHAAANGKEKKNKWLFKAPSFPDSVLRPRAQVSAPTLSTAVDASTLPPPPDNDPPVSFVSSTGVVPVDNKTARILATRRAKELEREAKEKEYVDGQHANIINGVWHCSNCGCPESIAIGRRKGPLGDKSQCGTCGKFWHRHRRPRPVEYNADAEYHINLRETGGATTSTKRKGRGHNAASQANDAPDTPSRPKMELDIPSNLPVEDDRPVSPASSSSSDSEPPLARQYLKSNGTPAPPPSTSEPPPPRSSRAASTSQDHLPEASTGASAGAGGSDNSYSPPPWLSDAMREMQRKYPDDKFEAILRKASAKTPPEWRLKCLDCPGKLYTPGPGETLANYEVHLRNRQHRQRVNGRLGLSS